MNKQLSEDIDVDDIVSRQKIQSVVKMFHGNLSAIYNFLQFSDISHAYREASFFTQRVKCEDLLSSSYDKDFYLEKTKEDFERK